MDQFFVNLGFTAASFVDPIGRSGGIWLLWDPTQVTVSTTYLSSQAIHASVSKAPFEEWILSAVYASPNPRLRDNFWDEIIA